ncbi:MAG: hypothetical protein IJM30_11975 [Thermoguttaceae bacterium]|nr:hypothetical protein [Thermoguttaceae bacterium]
MTDSRLTSRRSSLRAGLVLASVLIALVAFGGRSFAQGGASGFDGRPVPSPSYYEGVDLILSGDFSAAEAFYRRELRGAFRIGASLWLDSICYYAMIGESRYQAGDLKGALASYNEALGVALQYPNWLGRVTYATGVSTGPKPPAPWGASRRATAFGAFPSKATIVVGDKITEDRIKKGGALMEQKAIPIDPLEILRCIALSIRRRNEILGPLAPYDPTSREIYDSFQKRSVAPNHWSVTLLDVIWGLALVENDKAEPAMNKLTEALAMPGGCDHPLTATALFELGNLYLANEKPNEAARCYYEASVSAYHYGDYLLVEESLRNYSNVVKGLGRGGADPVLNLAYRWAKTRKNCQTLVASFGLELVEDFIYRGKLNLATSGLGAIEKTMRATAGRGLRTSRAADRWNYLNALLFYANGNLPDGDLALAKVVEGAKLRSTWAIQLIDLDERVRKGLSASGVMTPRNAADLYELLLREPTVVDWATRPIDSLAIQMIAPSESYERWFRILIERDLKDKAFEVAERVRRERFFKTQTYGGRLLSLRYVLTADDALITPSIRSARQAILLAYPQFAETLEEVETITKEIDSLPSAPEDAESKNRQVALLAALGEVSARQEAMLRFIAAGRSRIPYVFPPVYSVADVQSRLPDETAVLAYLNAGGETFGFMIGKENLDAWRVGSTARLGAAVGTFLKTIGNSEGTKQIDATALAEAHWKVQGEKLRNIVLGAQDVEADRFNIVFSKLVVVPDSVLWYLPFEALCLPALASTEETVEDDGDDLDDAEVAPLPGLSETSDDESENSDDQSSDGENEEEEDDLDAAYRATDAEASEMEDEAIEPEEVEPEDEPISEEPEETAEEPTVEETPIEEAAAPKRKSRSAREREALVEYEAGLLPMIAASELSIRYSATVGLSLPNSLGRNAFVATTLACGATYPKEPFETVSAAAARFAGAVPKTEAFRLGSIRAPGAVYAARLKRLVVFDEIVGNTWNWAPVNPADSRAGNSASDWIASPWGAPRLYVAPALRTRAEEALKNGGDGSELFLPILAMQASGADAMLLSRWRTGGRSAYDLATDFVKNYENEPVAEAWKHSALKLMKRDVVVEEEPRLRKLGRSDPTPKYDLPFWWAGYMVIDSGEAIQPEEIERLDEENVRKAEEENALLEGDDETLPESEKPENGESEGEGDENSDDQADDGVVAPKFVDKNGKPKSDKEFDLGPRNLTDEDLAELDEAGDDFFANDDEPEEPAPKAEDESGDEPGDESESPAENPEEGPDADSEAASDDEPSSKEPEPKEEPEVKPKRSVTVKPKTDSKDDSAKDPEGGKKKAKVTVKPKKS